MLAKRNISSVPVIIKPLEPPITRKDAILHKAFIFSFPPPGSDGVSLSIHLVNIDLDKVAEKSIDGLNDLNENWLHLKIAKNINNRLTCSLDSSSANDLPSNFRCVGVGVDESMVRFMVANKECVRHTL